MNKKFEKYYKQVNHKDPKVGKAIEKLVMKNLVKRTLKKNSEKD